MEMDDRSDSDEEVSLERETEEETEKEEEEEEEVQQEEKVNDGPQSTSLSKTRPEATPTPVSDSAVPAVPQLTIFYGGSVKVFNGIPEEKVMEIMRIATAAASEIATKTGDVKNIETDNTSSTPPQTKLPNTAAAVGSLLAQLCPSPKSSLCKIQAEFPIARRHSLQRFLEKRRDRLVTKNPYPSSPSMKVENDMKL